jgi:hypothetical protein
MVNFRKTACPGPISLFPPSFSASFFITKSNLLQFTCFLLNLTALSIQFLLCRFSLYLPARHFFIIRAPIPGQVARERIRIVSIYRSSFTRFRSPFLIDFGKQTAIQVGRFASFLKNSTATWSTSPPE